MLPSSLVFDEAPFKRDKTILNPGVDRILN
jgi:hypothetical protein